MGKRIIVQRRGKGSPTYRVPNYKFQPALRYREVSGKVVDIVNDKRRNPPLAKVSYDDKKTGFIVAPEGIRVGDSTENLIMPLSKINIGQEIFCIETVPNSGPKLCRTSGSSALLVSKGEKDCIIQMPSKKTKRLDLRCRATVGTPAGDGRLEKPWVKAGKKWHAMHARGKLYPRTSASKMNAIDHPFGGHAKLGRPKTISRHAPPGRKTGSIAARRTGKKKR